jgi:hypothetical protein
MPAAGRLLLLNREERVGADEKICYPARRAPQTPDDAMIAAFVRPIPARAFLPAGAVFILFLLVPLGLLAPGPALFAGATAARLLVPLFALIYIVSLSLACAVFTLYQEPFCSRFPGLRRLIVGASLILAAGLVLLIRHTESYREVLFVLASANLVVFALLLGNFLVSGLNRPSELVPVCLVMSAADLLSVFAGPSKQMIEGIDVFYRDGRLGTVPWSDFLLVKIAVPGVGHLLPVFGVADVVILAFLIAAAHKFRLDDNLLGRRLGALGDGRRFPLWFPAAAAGLVFALLAAHGFSLFLPALPVITTFFLGYTLPRHPQMRLLQRTEWAAVFISLALLSGWTLSVLTG